MKIAALWQTIIETYASEESEYWWASAKLNELTEDWRDAALMYTQGAHLSLEPYDFWIGAGRAWRRSSDSTEAIIAYEYAHQTKPDTAFPCLNLGNIYLLDKRQYEKALEWYMLAMNLEPQNFAPYYWVGVTYYSMGDNRAESYLSTALNMNPEHTMSAYYLAQIYHDTQDYPSAEAWLIYALENTTSPSGSWWLQLGDWRIERLNCEGAYEAYQYALDSGVAEQQIERKLLTLDTLCNQ